MTNSEALAVEPSIDEINEFKAGFSGILIEPSRGWMPINLREVWDYRYMIYFMVVRNLRASYQQTVLGPLWIIINGFVSMVVYSMVFGVIADLPSENIPYPLFSYAGLIPWTLFNSCFGDITSSMQRDAMLKKVYYPRLVTPLIAIANNIVNFLLSFILLFALMLYYGFSPTLNIIFLPFFFLLTILNALAFGIWLAPLQVRSRDVQHLVSYLLRFWFYATPVVYSVEALPEAWQPLIAINPMTGVINAFRWGLVGTDTAPDLQTTAITIAILSIILYGGLLFFKRQEQYFADLS